jgi:hypothetical protein
MERVDKANYEFFLIFGSCLAAAVLLSLIAVAVVNCMFDGLPRCIAALALEIRRRLLGRGNNHQVVAILPLHVIHLRTRQRG